MKLRENMLPVQLALCRNLQLSNQAPIGAVPLTLAVNLVLAVALRGENKNNK